MVLGCVILGSGVWIGWTAGRNYPENIVVSQATNITPECFGHERGGLQYLLGGMAGHPE